MKKYYYNIIDKKNKSKQKGSGSLNELINVFGENYIYLLREIEKNNENIDLHIKTENLEVSIKC